MSRRSSSPHGGRSPKRARRNDDSPEFDEMHLTQDDMDALDVFEANLSQRASLSQMREEKGSDRDSDEAIHEQISSDDPFSDNSNSKASKFPSFGSASLFQSAAKLSTINLPEPTSSQEPPEPDSNYDSWFESTLPEDAAVGFQPATVSFQSAASVIPSAFQPASKKGVLAPSAAALAKAAELMKKWEGTEDEATPALPPPGLALFQTASSLVETTTPARPALRNLINAPVSPATPDTPTPSAFSRASTSARPIAQPFASLKTRAKPFKSPLMKTVAKASSTPPSNQPHISTLPSSFASASSICMPPPTSTPARPKHPLAAKPITPSTYSSPTVNQTNLSASLPRAKPTSARHTPGRFKTPFKAGMQPGTPGHAKLQEQNLKRKPVAPQVYTTAASTPVLSTPRKTPLRKYFDLKTPPNRLTLATCGVLPRWYELGNDELPNSIVNAVEQMHPSLASYYSFYAPSTNEHGISEDVRIGPQEALQKLKEEGCSLATKEWVDNHWSLILWKLAGLAYLLPEREWYDDQKRWGWEEVRRQLLYRYEREINRGIRPALRTIATQDVPSVFPMVLCVTEVNWLEQTLLPDGKLSDPAAELQVTDGWYKIRAQIDAPLTRAITKGTLRVGRKIAVANAKLDSERKDPQEILEAGNSIKLVICGNSSHLAPWHAKLGFQKTFPIATMNSLTKDGGMVPAMELVVTKVHAIGYVQFAVDGKGFKRGPFDEREELALRDKWERKRELEYSKAREVFDKEFRRYSSYAERLERRAGPHFRPTEAGPPDRTDDYYDKLEEPDDAAELIARIAPSDAGWLAIRIRAQMEKRQETMSEEIEKDVNDICPPRNVISLRVLDVKDAHTERHPANREASLTVWDVLNVCLTEGRKPGVFEVGDRCRFTHLEPTSQSSWMDRSPGSQIILRSTKFSRITKLKH